MGIFQKQKGSKKKRVVYNNLQTNYYYYYYIKFKLIYGFDRKNIFKNRSIEFTKDFLE